MRVDIDVADAGTVRQDERHRWLEPATPATGFQDVRNRVGADRVALEGDGDRRGHFLRAVVIEQREEATRGGRERIAAGGQSIEERGADGDQHAEPVAGGMGLVLLPAGREQARQMLGVLDDRAGVVAARVPGDLLGPIEESDQAAADEQRERSPRLGLRNRGEVAIEPDVGRLSRRYGPHEVRFEGMRG